MWPTLPDHIRAAIRAADGSIAFQRFMDIALYGADGFYTAEAFGFGPESEGGAKRVIDDKGAKGNANDTVIKALAMALDMLARLIWRTPPMLHWVMPWWDLSSRIPAGHTQALLEKLFIKNCKSLSVSKTLAQQVTVLLMTLMLLIAPCNRFIVSKLIHKFVVEFSSQLVYMLSQTQLTFLLILCYMAKVGKAP